jgi:ketosteroid isomerase-like protein
MDKNLADRWFGAFRDKDVSELESILAEDFVHTSPYGEIKGRKAYLDLVRGNEEAFFSPRLETQDVIASGDTFVVRYLVNGNPACDCIYGENGQIAKIYSYYHVGKKPSF